MAWDANAYLINNTTATSLTATALDCVTQGNFAWGNLPISLWLATSAATAGETLAVHVDGSADNTTYVRVLSFTVRTAGTAVATAVQTLSGDFSAYRYIRGVAVTAGGNTPSHVIRLGVVSGKP